MVFTIIIKLIETMNYFVFAPFQLYADGDHRGIHGVLVPIRDENMQTLPGVTIDDMGHKIALNGVDNAKLSFDNVRVPRENLLNRQVLALPFLPTTATNYLLGLSRVMVSNRF